MAASQRGKLGQGFSILEIWKSVGERECARVRLSALVKSLKYVMEVDAIVDML